MVETVALELAGVKVVLISTGAAILSIHTPDRNGDVDDIVLGHPTLEDYAVDASGSYFGCIVGRVANRINQATFSVPDGPTVTLEANNSPHALHGGSRHWGRQEWAVEKHPSSCSVSFTLQSPDGDAGYPGSVEARVTYSLVLEAPPQSPGTPPGEGGSRESGGARLPTLRILMQATSDACTPVNMAQHTHWNLSGSQRVRQGQTIGTHELRVIGGSHYTPVDSTLIPTGELKRVSGTPLDFTQACVKLAPRLLELPEGIDHNFVITTDACGAAEECGSCGVIEGVVRGASEPGGMVCVKPGLQQPPFSEVPQGTIPVAELREPETGRGLVLSSNAPGLQVYTGNFLEGAPGKGGGVYRKQQSVCLETQTFPNSVNVEAFPSPFVRPGEVYRHRMDVWFFQFAGGAVA